MPDTLCIFGSCQHQQSSFVIIDNRLSTHLVILQLFPCLLYLKQGEARACYPSKESREKGKRQPCMSDFPRMPCSGDFMLARYTRYTILLLVHAECQITELSESDSAWVFVSKDSIHILQKSIAYYPFRTRDCGDTVTLAVRFLWRARTASIK